MITAFVAQSVSPHRCKRRFSHARNLSNYRVFSWLQIQKRLSLRLLRYMPQSGILPIVRWPSKKADDKKENGNEKSSRTGS